MNPEIKRLAAAQIREILEAHFSKTRYAHASLLARSGHLLEAEALLCRKGVPTTPRDIDLLARIAAKRHDLSQAKRLWQDALRLDPGNSAYLEALVKIKAIEHFQDLVSPLANLKRLAKLARWVGHHFVVFAKLAWCRVVAIVGGGGNRLVACTKAIRNLRKTKPSEPINPESVLAAPAEIPPEKAQTSAPIPAGSQTPTPPTEEKPAIDAKP